MYDYHTHSFFSDDCAVPMSDMIEAAIKKGVLEYAITDHFDPDYPDPNYPFLIDFPAYHKALEEKKEQYKSQIHIKKGLEVGIQHGESLKKCSETVNAYDYDFILGSFHCAMGQDLYGPYFEERSAEEGTKQYYEYMYDCLLSYSDYDVLGHFNVIDRYSQKVPPYKPYLEQIEAILIHIIGQGKGIEINTSSFRYGMGDLTTPSTQILKLYKELGGEIITIGSDAHKAADIGYKYDWACELMKTLGFRYLATFTGRQPNFVKL